MGLLFGITQGQVSEWVRQLTAVAGQLIPLHRPTRQARDLTQLLREQPELQELIIDGTERRLPRPQHRGKQKRFLIGDSDMAGDKARLLKRAGFGWNEPIGLQVPCTVRATTRLSSMNLTTRRVIQVVPRGRW